MSALLNIVRQHRTGHAALIGGEAAAEEQRRSSIRRSLAELHDKQCVAFETVATEVLFGGAAGGGKSYLMRVAAIVWCASIAGLQVYLFRRVRDDLIKNHVEGPKGFRALLAPWVHANWCRLSGNEIRFWNGSRIYMCHCQDERDIYKYQGAEMHVIDAFEARLLSDAAADAEAAQDGDAQADFFRDTGGGTLN